MKNKYILISIFVILFGVALSVILKLSNTQPQIFPKNMPSDFNFIFKYGLDGKNEINTFKQTYTSDMVSDPPITVEMKLSDAELKNIYQELLNLNLFNQSTKPSNGNMLVTPCSSNYLEVQINTEKKILSWDDCRGEINEKFTEFSNYMKKLIESKDEYKNIPKPNTGYL